MSAQEITPDMWQRMAERMSSVEGALRDNASKNEAMEKRQKEMLAAIHEISSFMERMNGGVKVVCWMGGVLVALGTFISWALSHVAIKT